MPLPIVMPTMRASPPPKPMTRFKPAGGAVSPLPFLGGGRGGEGRRRSGVAHACGGRREAPPCLYHLEVARPQRREVARAQPPLPLGPREAVALRGEGDLASVREQYPAALHGAGGGSRRPGERLQGVVPPQAEPRAVRRCLGGTGGRARAV